MARKRKAKKRPVWKGFLKIGLVTFPVQAFSARVKSESEVDLDWLHRDCHRRIQYRKVCPAHGEVGNDEIVSGYQISKGRYIVIEPEELQRLRAKGDKILAVDSMIGSDAIDSRFFTEKSYFLLPAEPVANKPYAVIAEAMDDQGRLAVARIVLFRREQLVALRVLDGVLIMTVLNHRNELEEPAAYAQQLPHPRIAAKERKMAVTLIEAMSDSHFDFGKYKDEYIEQLQKLIRLKSEGKPVEAEEPEEEPEVVNFMDALRASLERVRKSPGEGESKEHHKPRRRKAS